jgi:hypothetical protein
MRFFTVIDLRHLVLAFFLGAGAVLVIYLAFRYPLKRGKESDEAKKGEVSLAEGYPDDLRIDNNPVPPVLVYVFLGFVLWLICYVIFFGVLGRPV